MGTSSGVFVVRLIVFWGLYWSPYLGNLPMIAMLGELTGSILALADLEFVE